MQIEDEDIETPEFDEDALMAAAAAAAEDEDGSGEEAGDLGTATGGEAQAETTEADANALPGLEELRKIAAERAKAHAATQKTDEQPQAAAPDFSKLTEAMTGAAAFKEAVEAFATGDASKIAKLTGKDEASLYESWTQRAMKGDTAALEKTVAALQAKVAELEGKKIPDEVLTTDKLEEIEAQRAKERSEAEWLATLSDAKDFPILRGLSGVDRKMALDYAWEANGLLAASGKPFGLSDVSRYAEELASAKWAGIFKAQQQDGRAQQRNGATSEAAAISATSGSKRAGVTIDNRAAAETASSLPDVTDEAAYLARARKVAESL